MPHLGTRARENAVAAINGEHHAGDGPWTERAEEWLSHRHAGASALLVPSGTDALELAVMALGLGPGDEVICPSFTFTSTATAIQRSGARVVFADVDPGTQSLTPETIAPCLTERTAAVILVHYAGIGNRVGEIAAWLRFRGIALIEDNAHGLGGTWDGRPLGTFGALSALSFHESKNLSCGEGGALIVNDASLLGPAECIREKGTNRSAFMRGHVEKYTWVSPGSSFLLAEVLAAILVGQMDDFEDDQAVRLGAWGRYAGELASWATEASFALPVVPAAAAHPAHLFYLLAPDEGARRQMLGDLQARGVAAVFHYQPLHLSQGGRLASGHRLAECPVSTDTAARLLRLPLHRGLTDAEVDHVIQAVHASGMASGPERA